MHRFLAYDKQCGIHKTLLAREMRRMSTSTKKAVSILPDEVFTGEEKTPISQVRSFVLSQCDKLVQVASKLRNIRNESMQLPKPSDK